MSSGSTEKMSPRGGASKKRSTKNRRDKTPTRKWTKKPIKAPSPLGNKPSSTRNRSPSIISGFRRLSARTSQLLKNLSPRGRTPSTMIATNPTSGASDKSLPLSGKDRPDGCATKYRRRPNRQSRRQHPSKGNGSTTGSSASRL